MNTKKLKERPIAWLCPVCKKVDWNDTDEQTAQPEHIAYRGVDIGTCSGSMIPVYNNK